jgi:hypothetical protein
LGLLGLVSLSACTTVNIYAGDGSVAVHRGFGFVNLQARPGSTPMLFRGTSLGLQSGPWGHSLGYSQTSLALLPAGCHVVVMPVAESTASSPALQALREADPCAAPTPTKPGVH